MANALEAASLVMIPSGYEDGTLGSLKPTDGSGDFTFSRGSNLSATRINEQGYIEKGYENLLTYSNDLNQSVWFFYGAGSRIGGQAGYDGSNDAWLLTIDQFFRRSVSSSSLVSFSAYVKKADSNGVSFLAASTFYKFDLTNSGNALSANSYIEDVGNGWFRCSFFTNIAFTEIRIYPSNESGVAESGSIYIQDAMLNQGLVAYPYIETTTAPVAGGILEDEPRIDFSDGCGHLLLEPSRTNLITYSEFTDVTGVWFKSGATIDHNTEDTLSPEGYYNALKYNSPISTGSVYYSGIPVSQNTKYTFTFYVKKGTNEDTRLAVYDETNLAFIDIDVPYTASTEEWKRITHTFTTPANCTSARVYPQRYNSAGTIYFYGFQVEDDGAGGGSTYPTSYIPTYGTSQTRLEDNASNTNTIDADNDFTLFIETKANADADVGIFWIGSGNLGYLDTNSAANLRFRYANSNYETYEDPSVDFKFLLRKDGTNLKMYVNGTLEHTITTLPTGTQDITFREGQHKQFLIFPTALSDSECIALTTI